MNNVRVAGRPVHGSRLDWTSVLVEQLDRTSVLVEQLGGQPRRFAAFDGLIATENLHSGNLMPGHHQFCGRVHDAGVTIPYHYFGTN